MWAGRTTPGIHLALAMDGILGTPDSPRAIVTKEGTTMIAKLDLVKLETAIIAEGLDQPIKEQGPEMFAPKPALPNYVSHGDSTPEIGKLTAEVLVRDYEATAKEIETMGAELTALQKRMEDESQKMHEVIKIIKDLSDRYREQGKAIFKRIEDCAVLTQGVRETCEQMRQRLHDTSI
jgi:hypothetical protein